MLHFFCFEKANQLNIAIARLGFEEHRLHSLQLERELVGATGFVGLAIDPGPERLRALTRVDGQKLGRLHAASILTQRSDQRVAVAQHRGALMASRTRR